MPFVSHKTPSGRMPGPLHPPCPGATDYPPSGRASPGLHSPTMHSSWQLRPSQPPPPSLPCSICRCYLLPVPRYPSSGSMAGARRSGRGWHLGVSKGLHATATVLAVTRDPPLPPPDVLGLGAAALCKLPTGLEQMSGLEQCEDGYHYSSHIPPSRRALIGALTLP